MADGASQSQLRLSSTLEVTRGTTPSNPPYTVIPINSGSFLQVDKNFEQSNLINSTRDPGARVGGVAGVSGTITTPLIKEVGWEHWGESALSSVFASTTPAAVSLSYDSGAKTATRATGSFLTEPIATKLEVGDTLFIAGTAANQTQVAGALDAVSTTITVDTVDATTVAPSTGTIKIENELITYTGITATTFTGCTRGARGTTAASHADNTPVYPARTITGITATVLTFANAVIATEGAISSTLNTNVRALIPGTTHLFYTVEQFFQDKTLYEIYKGVETNTMAINIPTSGEISTEFAVLGTRYATGQVSGSTYTATTNRTPMAASVSGSSLTVNGSALGTCIESATININNNRALKYGVGEQFACFVEEGIRQVDLNFAAYLVDLTLQGYFQAETRFALTLTTVSADGDKFAFYFPRLVLTAAPKGISGQTIVENYSAAAEKDTTTGTSFYFRELSAV